MRVVLPITKYVFLVKVPAIGRLWQYGFNKSSSQVMSYGKDVMKMRRVDPWSDSDEVIGVARLLHDQLRISSQDWHRFRAEPRRRAAELLASALLQIIGNGKLTDAAELTEQSLRWLQGEVKDPGCSQH